MPDGRIAIFPKFLQDYPQYEGQDWYCGEQRKPVSPAQYLKDFPPSPGAEADLEDSKLLSALSVGLTWAYWQLACKNRIYVHLREVFDQDTSKMLLFLTIYKFSGGTAMSSYDLWTQQVWFPENIRLTGQKISAVLASISKDQIDEYFKLRHDHRCEIRKKESSPTNGQHRICLGQYFPLSTY